ncbi:MAG: type II toxin-antitoxin system death-on-curing family toxin [Desulfarculaceae bacterium]|nr:type II toxin-antitoxin system death-on-curing family toxin [Desulfarculaceae bacterium]
MKPEPVWIPLRAIIDLQVEQIAEHGGLAGLREPGGLEAALARPRQVFSYGEGASLARLAAAHAWGISRNHPFVDGNKRMALLAVHVFLGLNGLHFDAREEDAYRVIMALADGELSEEELTAWIEENSFPRD